MFYSLDKQELNCLYTKEPMTRRTFTNGMFSTGLAGMLTQLIPQGEQQPVRRTFATKEYYFWAEHTIGTISTREVVTVRAISRKQARLAALDNILYYHGGHGTVSVTKLLPLEKAFP